MCSADGGPRPLFFPVYSAGPLYLHGYDLYSMQSNQCKHIGPTTAPPKKKTAKLTTGIHHTKLSTCFSSDELPGGMTKYDQRVLLRRLARVL